MMKTAIYPGSFDPVTYGHLDIIKRSAKFVDRLIVAAFINPNKKHMFTIEERMDMLKETTKTIPNVEVDALDGLLYEYAKKRKGYFLIRGLRAFSDFDYEFQRAMMIKEIDSRLETLFLMTDMKYSYISSTGVRELAHFAGQIDRMVPPYVAKKINLKIHSVKK